MNELCNEKHKRIDERLDVHDKRLDIHGEKIDTLEKSDAVHTNQIDTICKSMGGLTKAIWGLVTAIGTALIGFFFYAVQQDIFK